MEIIIRKDDGTESPVKIDPARYLDNGGNCFGPDGMFNPSAFNPAAVWVPPGHTFRLKSNPNKIWADPFDLRNLRFIQAENVIALLKELEEKAMLGQPVCCVLASGGTLAAVRNAIGNLEPGLSIADLLGEVGGSTARTHLIAGMPHRKLIDSSQQQIDYVSDMIIVMSWIWRNASDNLKRLFEGFMVPHGTDTIATAAPYTAMMLGADCPFSCGFVGAQRTRDEKFSDVGVNIRYCLDTLALLHERGIVLSFVYGGGTAGGAYSACSVIKSSDVLIEFLSSPGFEKLVTVNKTSGIAIVAPFQEKFHRRDGFFRPWLLRGYRPVVPITSEMGFSPELAYRMIAVADEPAIIFGSFAAFTAPDGLFRAVQEAAADYGKLLFVANCLAGGNIGHTYQASAQLRKEGANPTNMLPGPLAAKITLGLGIFGADYERVVEFVTRHNVVGEQILNDGTMRLGMPNAAWEEVST